MLTAQCEQMPEHRPSIDTSIAHKHHAQALLEQCHARATNERTQLTNIYTHAGKSTYDSNARRGVARFHPFQTENPPTACAARGLIGASHA